VSHGSQYRQIPLMSGRWNPPKIVVPNFHHQQQMAQTSRAPDRRDSYNGMPSLQLTSIPSTSRFIRRDSCGTLGMGKSNNELNTTFPSQCAQDSDLRTKAGDVNPTNDIGVPKISVSTGPPDDSHSVSGVSIAPTQNVTATNSAANSVEVAVGGTTTAPMLLAGSFSRLSSSYGILPGSGLQLLTRMDSTIGASAPRRCPSRGILGQDLSSILKAKQGLEVQNEGLTEQIAFLVAREEGLRRAAHENEQAFERFRSESASREKEHDKSIKCIREMESRKDAQNQKQMGVLQEKLRDVERERTTFSLDASKFRTLYLEKKEEIVKEKEKTGKYFEECKRHKLALEDCEKRLNAVTQRDVEQSRLMSRMRAQMNREQAAPEQSSQQARILEFRALVENTQKQLLTEKAHTTALRSELRKEKAFIEKARQDARENANNCTTCRWIVNRGQQPGRCIVGPQFAGAASVRRSSLQNPATAGRTFQPPGPRRNTVIGANSSGGPGGRFGFTMDNRVGSSLKAAEHSSQLSTTPDSSVWATTTEEFQALESESRLESEATVNEEDLIDEVASMTSQIL